MSELRKVGDIQIEEDQSFTQKEWRVQRIGWVIMGLILVAAVVGAFGRGPISRTTAGDPQSFAVDYPRIMRHAADDDLTVHIGAGTVADSQIQLAVSREFVEKNEIRMIVPQPESEAAAGDFYVYDFKRADTSSPMEIVLLVKPSGYGSTTTRLQLIGGTALTINQFIMP